MVGWPQMIYKITVSWFESVETNVNGYLLKLQGVSKSLPNVSLYCDEMPCLFWLHSLVTEFKKPKVRGLLQLQQLEDQSVRDNVLELYKGRKWKVAVEASSIDSIIKMSKNISNVQIGRTGLGYIKRRKQQNRWEFLKVIKKIESERIYTKAVQQSVQEQWSKW